MVATVETQFYHGQGAWGEFGTRLHRGITREEAEKKSNLAWGVTLRPIFDGSGQPISGFRVVVRTDINRHLGIVGPKYRTVQNADLFALNEALIGEGAVYESAGSLRGGQRVWILSRIPGDVWVTKEDHVGKFLLWTTRHDGKSSLWGLVTPVRFACENALQRAISSAGEHCIAIRHTQNYQEKVVEARRTLGLSLKYYDTWAAEAQDLARKPVGIRAVARYFRDLVPNPPEGMDATRARSTRRELHRLFEEGRGNDLPTVRGTLWAAVNAVADFVDHTRTTRRRKSGEGDANSNALSRFESALFGSGATLKTRAWDTALKLL